MIDKIINKFIENHNECAQIIKTIEKNLYDNIKNPDDIDNLLEKLQNLENEKSNIVIFSDRLNICNKINEDKISDKILDIILSDIQKFTIEEYEEEKAKNILYITSQLNDIISADLIDNAIIDKIYLLNNELDNITNKTFEQAAAEYQISQIIEWFIEMKLDDLNLLIDFVCSVKNDDINNFSFSFEHNTCKSDTCKPETYNECSYYHENSTYNKITKNSITITGGGQCDDIMVKNINGTSKSRYKIPRLFQKYKSAGGYDCAKCQVKGCSNVAQATSHVIKTDKTQDGNKWFLIRTCAQCNNHTNDKPMPLRKNAKLIEVSSVRNARPTTADNKTVYVNGYTRSNGTVVNGYSRSAPQTKTYVNGYTRSNGTTVSGYYRRKR